MHTSATAAAGSPNPQAGTILVRLSDNFSQLYYAGATLSAPKSGSDILVASAGVTAGLVYTITTVGTTTTAGWISLGLPPGVTPTAGASFVAIATATATGTGAVQVPASEGSDIDHVELVGTATLTLAPVPVGGSPNVGGQLIFNCYEEGVLAAPADGTVIRLLMYLSQSSVTVAGE